MDLADKDFTYRYERKFLTRFLRFEELENLVRMHPACFTEIFHIRQVNNVYFDTPGLRFFEENVAGQSDRMKVRIRWYGTDDVTIDRPVLEFKYKRGFVGRKASYPLVNFRLPNRPDKQFFMEILTSSELPADIVETLAGLEPVILNRYRRKYFLSFDRNFRITLDKNLSYFDIRSGHMMLGQAIQDSTQRVMELKYDSKYDSSAAWMINQFPMRVTKSSKYVSGMFLIRPDLAV